MARVQLFIDGFNLYHSIMRDPKLRGYRWLSFRALGESVITRNEVLTDIYYFTAFYPGDAAKTKRHNLFINAQALHGVTTVLGAFRAKAKYCPLCGKTSRGYEEKETDVNMAVYLLKNAVLNEYDKAIIISNDSDLLPVLRAVRQTYPTKQLKMLFPPGGACESLKAEVPDYMRMKEKHLQENQFPNPIVVGKLALNKPPGW